MCSKVRAHLGRLPLSNVAGNTKEVPRMQGIPRTMQGIPRTMKGIPRTIQGIPRIMQGIPRTMQGIPRTMQGIPRTMPGIPRKAKLHLVREWRAMKLNSVHQ